MGLRFDILTAKRHQFSPFAVYIFKFIQYNLTINIINVLEKSRVESINEILVYMFFIFFMKSFFQIFLIELDKYKQSYSIYLQLKDITCFTGSHKVFDIICHSRRLCAFYVSVFKTPCYYRKSHHHACSWRVYVFRDVSQG